MYVDYSLDRSVQTANIHPHTNSSCTTHDMCVCSVGLCVMRVCGPVYVAWTTICKALSLCSVDLCVWSKVFCVFVYVNYPVIIAPSQASNGQSGKDHVRCACSLSLPLFNFSLAFSFTVSLSSLVLSTFLSISLSYSVFHSLLLSLPLAPSISFISVFSVSLCICLPPVSSAVLFN